MDGGWRLYGIALITPCFPPFYPHTFKALPFIPFTLFSYLVESMTYTMEGMRLHPSATIHI